jgi:hypothetical protein
VHGWGAQCDVVEAVGKLGVRVVRHDIATGHRVGAIGSGWHIARALPNRGPILNGGWIMIWHSRRIHAS